MPSSQDEYEAINISSICMQQKFYCHELKSLKLDKRTNSCIGVNTRELDRELFTK